MKQPENKNKNLTVTKPYKTVLEESKHDDQLNSFCVLSSMARDA